MTQAQDPRRLKPGLTGRLRWAIRTKRRPRNITGLVRLLWHDFVIHVLFEGVERCQDCGHGYPLWRAGNDLWLRVHGSPGGLLCPACFDRQARAQGIVVDFLADEI